MPVRTCLEILDYHKRIQYIPHIVQSRTDHKVNFHSIETEPIDIVGHWEDVSYAEIQRDVAGLYNVGDRKFCYSGILRPRDELIIEELDGSLSRWEVKGIDNTKPFWDKIGVFRNTYHLTRIAADFEEYHNQEYKPKEPVESPTPKTVKRDEYIPSWRR